MERFIKIIEKNWLLNLLIILLINFSLRFLIFNETTLFNFSDYKVYLSGIEKIHNEGSIPLVSGNFIFTISYIGFYAKYILGSIGIFYVFNSLIGTLTTFLLALLIVKISGKPVAGVITAIILTFYTEFMVFSSVFYTPVIMLFLLSLFLLLIFNYLRSFSPLRVTFSLSLLLVIYLLTFLFKPELIFLPFFLVIFTFFVNRKKQLYRKSMILSIALLTGLVLVKLSGVYDKVGNDTIANDFIFFGHTDYGGDGGEGAFIYPENKARYEAAFKDFCIKNNINNPKRNDYNVFQSEEIKRFITQHPFKWIGLQFTKFFRTFGVVPETTSFKILYTGLFKGNLWLSSIIVVVPVASIIILFILFFNYSAVMQLINGSTLNSQISELNAPGSTLKTQYDTDKTGFLFIYLLLFIYYLIATIFCGQYQERYRLPLMAIYLVPGLGYFIASIDKKQFFNKVSLSIKVLLIVLFLVIWSFQAKKAISNKERFNNAIGSVK